MMVFLILLFSSLLASIASAQQKYILQAEDAPHEATWLSWPHHYTYGKRYRKEIEKTWLQMTKALAQSEKVYIVAYKRREQRRITKRLRNSKIPLESINFVIQPTDDTWIRDNGPMFVANAETGAPAIIDWGFNGWGGDAPYSTDDKLPEGVSKQLNGLAYENLNSVVMEGGAIEVDGKGTVLATKSSVLKNGRNSRLSNSQVEEAMMKYLGIEKFIWLDGRFGGKGDITDMHIDGFARFGTVDTIVTMSPADLRYWQLSESDIDKLMSASDKNNKQYKFVYLPLTKSNVKTTYGKSLGYKGSYVNFYVANTVVLMPSYNDPNDGIAQRQLKALYPNKRVVKIDVRNLYKNGGMVHCVTMQQPKDPGMQ